MGMFNRVLSLFVILAVGPFSAVAAFGGVASGEKSEVVAQQALEIAALGDGRSVFRCEGDSMQPFFGPGSFALVREASFQDLKAGMVVIYRDREGDHVAHRLHSRQGEGWKAKGQNNRRFDPQAVSADNFVGVVYAVLHSRGDDASEMAWFGEIPIALGKSD